MVFVGFFRVSMEFARFSADFRVCVLVGGLVHRNLPVLASIPLAEGATRICLVDLKCQIYPIAAKISCQASTGLRCFLDILLLFLIRTARRKVIRGS